MIKSYLTPKHSKNYNGCKIGHFISQEL